MSRTAIKSFGLLIIGQIAILVILAFLLCLTAPKTFAQDTMLITPGDVTANTTYYYFWGPDPFGVFYRPNNPLLHWNLRLGEGGTINFTDSSRFRFYRNSSDPTTEETDDGAAINIFHDASGTTGNYTFSAGYTTYNQTPNFNINYNRSSFGFEGNRTSGRGGALYVENANVTLRNLFFIDNHTIGIGGGLRGGGALFQELGTGTISLTDVAFGGWTRWAHFANSTAAAHPTAADTAWGALLNASGNYYMRRSTMGGNWSNTTVSSGGAIFSSGAMSFAADANVSVTGIAIANNGSGGLNTGTTGSNSPGGIRWRGINTREHLQVYTLHDTRNTFYDNSARYDGGAIFNLSGPLTFEARAVASATATAEANNSVNTPGATRIASAYAEAVSRAYGADFRGNVAGRDGGAIFVQNGTLTFTAGSVSASTTVSASATAGGGAGQNAEAYAAARSWAEAYAAYFADNQAERGGAIFNSAGGILNFSTTGVADATVSSTITAPTPTGDPARYVEARTGYHIVDDPIVINPSEGIAVYVPQAITASIYSYAGFFTDNVARLGGAIFNDGGTLSFSTSADTYIPSHTPGGWSWGRGLTGITVGTQTDGSGINTSTSGGGRSRTQRNTMQTVYDTAAGVFENNRATTGTLGTGTPGQVTVNGRGGAIYNRNGGDITFIGHNRFYYNVAQQFGGAIYNESGLLTFTANSFGGTVFYGNGTGFGLSTVSGGAIYNEDEVVMTGSYLVSNHSTQTGGAIFNDEYGVITLTNVIFQSNYASATSWSTITAGTSGGAIYNLGHITIAGSGTGQGTAGRFGNDQVGTGNRAAFGGAIHNHLTGTMDLTNLRFAYNEATNRGGAIYNTGGSVTITGVRFLDNKATGAGTGQGLGGAIYHDSASVLTISTGTSFSVNSAVGSGGAIFNALGRRLTIDGVTFDRNNAGGGGGALWNDGVGTITTTTFEQNTDIPFSTGRVGQGGAIYNTENGELTISASTFMGNRVSNERDAAATGFGGAIYNNATSTKKGVLWFINNNVFETNQAHSGGAIYNNEGEISITGGRFGNGSSNESNTALYGAAIYNKAGELNLNTVNFFANQAYVDGGAIYNEGGTINLLVAGGATSTFEGNKAGTWNFSGPGSPITGINESIFFAGTGNVFNVTTNGNLLMYDPMNGGLGSATTITKTGNGTWLLAGMNDFTGAKGLGTGTGRANFLVTAGTLRFELHNYATGEAHTTLHLGGNGLFRLNSGSTLSIGETTRNAGSAITAGTINMQQGSTLEFHLTKIDLDRTRNIPNSQAVLTLTGTITVNSNINAWLTGTDIDGNIGMTWFDWFEDDWANNYIFIIDAGGTFIDPPVIDVWQRATNSDAFVKYRASRVVDGTGAHVFDFIATDGKLRLAALDATQWETQWTGLYTNVWNTTTQNWYGTSGGGWTDTFYRGDHVRFTDASYDYIDGSGNRQSGTPRNRNVVIGSDVNVSSLEVTGTGYSFTLAPGVKLVADTHRNPNGTGNVNGWINFGSGTTVNIRSDGAGTTTTIGNNNGTNSITFGANSVLRFDLTAGANHNDTLLALNASAGQLTLGRLEVAHLWTDIVDGLIRLNPSEHVTFIQATGNVLALQASPIYDVAGIQLSPIRAASGVVYSLDVQGDKLNLVAGPITTTGANLQWTGNKNGLWDTTTPNWFGRFVGSGSNPYTTYTFRNDGNDQVTFGNTYTDEQGSPQPVRLKNVAIDQDVNVYIMRVEGSDYVFDLATNTTLKAGLSINFGSATINMDTNSNIVAGSGGIIFGTGGLNAKAATIYAAHDTKIKSSTISFNGDSDFYFDLTGVGNDDKILTFEGTVNGVVGGGRIDVGKSADILALNLNPGDSITLIQIDGSGNVTASGTLYVDNNPYVQERGNATGVMLGLGVDNMNDPKALLLKAADADANADLYWTGLKNNSWSTSSSDTNWSGLTTEEVHVTTFLNGDRVIFGNASNKNVNVASGGVTVADMNVTSTGYTFDLRSGGITADASVSKLDGSQSGFVAATGNINFGNGTTITSGINSSVTAANGTITFGTDTVFRFDLAGVATGDKLLLLDGNVIAEAIGSGRIEVFGNVPSLDTGRTVVLVDAGMSDTTASTGDLYVNGVAHVAQRSSNPGATMYGLDTNPDHSQLLLRWVNANTNTDNLVWTGADDRVVKNYYIWGEGSQYPNWNGTVAGIKVKTFLDWDSVRFDNTVSDLNRRKVTIDEGGVNVKSMTVAGSDYIFDLRGGGITGRSGGSIHAADFVALNDATIVVEIRSDFTANQITAKEIFSNGATVQVVGTDLDYDLLLQKPGGVMDVEILVSSDAPIKGNVNSDLTKIVSDFYSASFFVDNTTTSGRGIVRLSYFFYESLGWNQNTREAGKALDELRFVDRYKNDALFAWIRNNPKEAMSQLRGTELVADSLAMAMWRPWEITHQRGRNVREETGWNSWGTGYYQSGDTKGDGNAEKYDINRGGMMIGADYGSNKYWQFGGAFGYGVPNIQNAFGKVEAGDLTLGAYSKINFFDQAWVSTFLGYGYQSYKMTRYNFGEKIQSDYDGDAWYASVEFVKPITVSIVTMMPLVALDHQMVWTNGFSEPGLWGQTLASTSMDRTMVRFGVDSKLEGIGGGNARVDLSTRLQAAFLLDGDKRATVVSHFPMTGASMTLRGAKMGWGQLNAGLTASGEYRKKYHWFLGADAFLTDRTTSLEGHAGLSTRF